MTLAEKAANFEKEIDLRHRRTSFGYVTNAKMKVPGDRSTAQAYVTDNDGQYTSLYGAAMAFRYAVTKDAKDRAIAQRSFAACTRLVASVPESSVLEPEIEVLKLLLILMKVSIHLLIFSLELEIG